MVHRPAEVVARHPPRRLAVALLVVAEAVKHPAAAVAAVERKVVVEAGLTRHQSFPCPFRCFSCCRG